MRLIGLLLVTLCMAGCTASSPREARSPPIEYSQATACHPEAPADIVKATVPGHPFEALASRDGCRVFVSLISSSAHSRFGAPSGGIGVLQWTGSRLALERLVPLSPPEPAGMALSSDGRLLAVADGRAVHFLDVGRLLSGSANPLLGSIRDGNAPGSVNAAFSRDDRTLFVSDEDVGTVTVIDVESARQSGFRQSAIIGKIPTGRAPVGLAFSEDGHYLFITSESWPARSRWPADCRVPSRVRLVAAGAVETVDVARARERPGEAVIGVTPAGCSPVRAVLSPDGTRLYVSARASNAVLVFDAERLVREPSQALVSTVPVGTAPVGIEVVQHGERVVVADSSRFGGSGGRELTVLDASRLGQGRAAVIGTIPVGSFPRELHATPNGQALLLTDFDSDRIELIPITRLPE